MNNTPTNPEAESKEAHPLDPRIANALQELGICYDTDPEGNFYMLVEFDDNRFQQVCIRSRTQEFLGVEMREIFPWLSFPQEFWMREPRIFSCAKTFKKILGPGPFYMTENRRRPFTLRRSPRRCPLECSPKS